MTFDPDDVLRRFHRALVREIQGSNPEHLSAPFSVAEIYQNLVPYRTHRDEIGVEMNADYEHALLRLLSGEGDFLSIESRTARQEIREELDSPNPNTGLYRDFAAADVRLNPDKIDEALAWDPGEMPLDVGDPVAPRQAEEAMEDPFDELAESDASEEGPGDAPGVDSEVEAVDFEEEEVVEEEAGVQAEEFPDTDTGVEEEEYVDLSEVEVKLTGQDIPWPEETEETMVEEDPDGGSVPERPAGFPPETCAWCREALPQRSGVNFCPFCGCSVHLVPCPECGEELEMNWRFCIACGTEVSS